MGIRNEVCLHTYERQQFPQDFTMPLGRLRNPHHIARQPFENLAPCLSHRPGSFEYPRTEDDTNKTQEAWPRQSNLRPSTECVVEPFLRNSMLRQRGYVRVDQKVGIHQDHLNASPSTIESSSLTLSMLGTLSRPRSTDRVRNGRRSLGRRLMSSRPRRSASLIRSRSFAPRALRNRTSTAATSSSIVRVVRMHQSILVLMS